MGGLFTKFFAYDDNKTIVDPDEPQVALVHLNFPQDFSEGDAYFIDRVNTHSNGSKTIYLARMEDTQVAYV